MKRTNQLTAIVFLLTAVMVTPARAAWPVRFGDGTAVEVIGITEDGKKWWLPDGSPADDPQFQSNGTFQMRTGGAGGKSLQVIVKTNAADMKGKNLAVRAGPEFDAALLKVADTRGELVQVTAPTPLDKATIALRFGLASGPGAETILWQRAGEPAAAPATRPADVPFRFVEIADDHGQTIVRLQRTSPARQGARPNSPIGGGGVGGGGGGNGGQMRGSGPGGPNMLDLIFGDSQQDQKVMVQAHGQSLRPVGFDRTGDGLLNLRFRCPKDQVEKVILTSRVYEWIEMQNISTQPAATPTDVKVLPLKDAPIKGTTPSTGTPPPRG